MDLDRIVKKARRRPLFQPAETSIEVTIGRDGIERMIPHRDPFLLVDRITQVDLDQETMRAHRRIDPADPILAGHFPGEPVYPGALLVEAMGQASLCLQHLLEAGRTEVLDDDTPRPVRLLRIHQALFQDAARPDDEMTLLCRRLATDPFTVTCAAQALRGDTVCAIALMDVFMVDEDE
ncbi:MAG: beta-hydroxyacyl-ACP dehydratase [Deltaproteobacteria bacterium]|nr:beta-hydroxyacyl-ACP dehydratase [Deltaproteobacteria bacterium]